MYIKFEQVNRLLTFCRFNPGNCLMNTKSNSHNLAAMIPVERVQKIPGHVESWSIWFIRKSNKISGCLSFYTKLFLISCVCVFFLLILFCCCCCFFYFKWYYLKILNFPVYINVNLLPYVLLWMLKLDPHLLKNCFICFNESPSKITRNTFYFVLKASFILNVIEFLSLLFGRVGKTAWSEK